MKNRLYYGDCLTIIQREMEPSSVDLIYLDPPFNSNRNYNAIYKDETGRPLPEQVEAFCDTWELDAERLQVVQQLPILMREAGIGDDVAEFWRLWMSALRATNPRLLAYLSYMAERLLPMRGVLRPTGSIYLHCDPTASHYLKILMDSIFGHANFRNEIVWCYRGGGVPKKDFARKHDIILRYSRGENYTFNVDDVRIPYSEDSVERLEYPARSFRGEKVYGSYKPNPQGKHPEDWWVMQPIMPSSKERLGYATQKPLTLMRKIIKASSNEGDVVFDPFCGCATTLEAAHTLGRKWIGIDITIHAIKRVSKVRLEDKLRLAEGVDFTVEGVPGNLEGAQDLWARDKYHFQKWAVEEVNGFVTSKRTADGGIDGRIYFHIPHQSTLQSMVLEVKGGQNVTIADVRALHSVLEREDARMAGLIIMRPLGETKKRNFQKLMAEAGVFEVMGKTYRRMQILTVPEILEGKRFDTPGAVGRGNPQKVLELPMGGSTYNKAL